MKVPLAIAETRSSAASVRVVLDIDQLEKHNLDDSTGSSNADDNRHVERC